MKIEGLTFARGALAFMIIVASSASISEVCADAPEIMYVQAAKAQLKTEPKMTAPSIKDLKRGEKLMIRKQEGIWYQVVPSGWVSKLFVANHPPVGEAELAKQLEGDQGLAKAARKRAGAVAVSASTRGLVSGNRMREGREKYESDLEAVKKMESLDVNPNELHRFQSDGKLLR